MKKQNREIAKKGIRMLTGAAMLTAMSVVIGAFCKSFMNFGEGLFRISFENLPIIISGIAFGPLVGGAVGCAADLISYLLSPQIYPPNLIVTLGATAVGAVSGIIFRILPFPEEKSRIALSGISAHVVGSMIIKPIGLYQFYGILVLWRIPIYLAIVCLEIPLLCLIFNNKAIRRYLK